MWREWDGSVSGQQTFLQKLDVFQRNSDTLTLSDVATFSSTSQLCQTWCYLLHSWARENNKSLALWWQEPTKVLQKTTHTGQLLNFKCNHSASLKRSVVRLRTQRNHIIRSQSEKGVQIQLPTPNHTLFECICFYHVRYMDKIYFHPLHSTLEELLNTLKEFSMNTLSLSSKMYCSHKWKIRCGLLQLLLYWWEGPPVIHASETTVKGHPKN